MGAWFFGGALVAACACSRGEAPAAKTDVPVAALPSSSPVTSASASARSDAPPASLQPVVRAEQRAAGLHVRSGTLDVVSRWGFSDLGVDLGKIKLEIVLATGGAELASLLPPRALAIVNGGYFEADFRPSMWLKQGGVELARKTSTSRGGVLALAGRDAYLGPFSGLRFEPELAVQSFPLIVESDGSSGIRSDDGRRAARTVVCWVGPELHFIVIAAPRGEGPTLFESAELLRRPWPAGFGCRAALNLDGGPSSGVWFAPSLDAKQRAPFALVAYGIALVPR
jgi:hypothetical protein